MENAPPPLPVLPLAYAAPELRPRTRVVKVTARLSIFILVVGAGVCWFEVESVMITGPILAIVGAVMTIFGLQRRRTGLWLPGVLHLAICGLFLVLVNGLNWSPRQAQLPFSIMSTVYALGMTVWLSVMLRQERQRAI